MDPLERVFRHLDRWRHLPNYQLERRADIFFSVYLGAVVEEFTGVALEEEFLPEFPLKRELSDKSVKVDYVLFAKDRIRLLRNEVAQLRLQFDRRDLRGDELERRIAERSRSAWGSSA